MTCKSIFILLISFTLFNSQPYAQTLGSGVYTSFNEGEWDLLKLNEETETLVLYPNFNYEHSFPQGLSGNLSTSFGSWSYLNDSIIELNSYYSSHLAAVFLKEYDLESDSAIFEIKFMSSGAVEEKLNLCTLKFNNDEGYLWSRMFGGYYGDKGEPDTLHCIQLLYYHSGAPFESQIFNIEDQLTNRYVIWVQLPPDTGFIYHQGYRCRIGEDGLILERLVLNQKIIGERELSRN